MQATYSSEKLVGLLDSTLNPSLRKQAEDELSLVINVFEKLFYCLNANFVKILI